MNRGLIEELENSIKYKKDIREYLETDIKFVRKVPYKLKELFYQAYDCSLRLNYEVLYEVKKTRTKYEFSKLHDRYLLAEDSFVDVIVLIIESYGVDEKILFT